ncbi:MAG: hypothetical protein HY692_02700, partial [Cyanobacteria bacterium NC_groundwater_1444_Ag_S-0.65um_54_12]|nr:hypothetical protein [Cyanobacteria bacterium NC_groundwater_1444_Ag_S-0.65um_54_12]
DPGELVGLAENAVLGERTVTLRDGASVNINMQGYAYTASPIIFDLTGLNKPDLLAGSSWRLQPGRSVADAALRSFDLDGTGKIIWEWVGPRSGLLVWDPEGKGQITSGWQLFGNHTWNKRWKDGYEPLATLDRNKDGWLAGAELAGLGIWVDTDSNAVSDQGEVHPVQHWGIDAIATRAERDPLGNAWSRRGFRRVSPDGQRRWFASWDWISLGLAKNTEGTYVWVGKDGENNIGGILRLRSDEGKIRGLAVPTIGVKPLPKGLMAAFPIAGRVNDRQLLKWRTPAPRGSRVESEVLVKESGNYLHGRTYVTTPQKKWSYDWQAELVAGQAINTAKQFTGLTGTR